MKIQYFFVKFKTEVAFLKFLIFKKKVKKKRQIRKKASSDFNEFNDPVSRLEREQGEARRARIFSFIFLFTFSLLIVYQNCSPPPPQGLFQRGSRLEPYQEPMPFAYDVSIDTLSYMSCSGIQRGREPEGYYTFKVGAYGEGSGLRLKDEFRWYKEEYTEEELLETFVSDRDHINAKLRIQLSIRSVINLFSGSLGVSGHASKEGLEYKNIFPILNYKVLMQDLFQLEEKKGIRIVDGLPLYDKSRFFEGALHFASSEGLAGIIRSQLNKGDLFLTLTFAKEVEGLEQRAFPYLLDYEKYEELKSFRAEMEENNLEITERDWIEFLEVDQTKVYGLGYQIKYEGGLGLTTDGTRRSYTREDGRRVLSSVTEIDLVSKNDTKRIWECDSYIIIRSRDNELNILGENNEVLGTEFLCPMDEAEDPHYEGSSYQALRAILPADVWFINRERKCIVSKKGSDSCYLDTRTHQREQSEDTTNVRPYFIKYDGGHCGGGSDNGDCPHYVSICYLSQN